MAALRHPNVVMFMGLCLEPPCIVTEFCARGSLYDVLKKARTSSAFAQQLDWSKRLTMALDAAKVWHQLTVQHHGASLCEWMQVRWLDVVVLLSILYAVYCSTASCVINIGTAL